MLRKRLACIVFVTYEDVVIKLILVFSDKMGSKLFIVFLGIVCFASAAIPPYIKVCKSSEANLASCIIESVNLLKPTLKEGIPELNVPPIEPLLLDEVKLRSGPSSAKINANITNIKVWGPSTFEILELKPNLPKAKFAFKVRIPSLHFEGDYDIDMRILVLEYKGVGPITGNFTNYSFDCILKGNRIQKDGEEYLKFDKMRLRLNIGHSRITLGNLFRDDPIIGRATNDVINDNTDLFINEIKPVLENSLAEKFTDIANKITLKFTYKELFP
ncbi:protein takeout-like [Tribolium madens]|uniref:protein takeout-like n=1 Tax=Tribolium madens TaxID=41895 RepID=UPI001CF73182|nr:protein takeout-like [Tribolium madens]